MIGAERLLMVLTPVVAMAAVGVGLQIGGGEKVRAALVSGAPAPPAATAVTWPVVVFDDDHGIREGVAGSPLDATATGGGRTAHWSGATNEDGAAEMTLQLPPPSGGSSLHLEVRSSGALLASGDVTWPAAPPHDPPSTGWARFARREGDVALQVAVLGQRVASGFPAGVWVRATDGKTEAPLAGVVLSLDSDPALRPATSSATTDAGGWAHFTATPLGYSVPFVLHAKAADGRAGEWAGGLFVSPGASGIAAKDLYTPEEGVAFDVTVPTVRTTAYVEIDSAGGRVWAAALALQGGTDGAPRAHAVVTGLAPGLYWIVAAGDPDGASALGPGTIARPFFVAKSPDDALRFGTDPATCVAPGDARLATRAASACLAVVAPAPVPRWTALDGFAFLRARDARARARGLAVALGAIFVAILLEALLVLRAAATARARIAAAEASEAAEGARLQVHRAWSVAVALLLAMLGFTLLAAFLVRVG